MESYDAVVIGAGQAGLSAAHHLGRLGLSQVVLDANPEAGGAWQHRWDSLTMLDVHGVAALPGSPAPDASEGRRANEVVPEYFADYERHHDISVLRPVRVERVEDRDGLLETIAGERHWLSRTLVNATGTWSHPFVPVYPGMAGFLGEQYHTQNYPGAERFRGRRTVVVGGGASAVQLLGEIALVTDTVWVTRRAPRWRSDDFSPEARTQAVALVADRVRRGLPPASVVSVTGLVLRDQEQEAARLGAYRRRPMFAAVEPDGVRWADGSFEPADAIVWATGFRPAIQHLAPLRLRSPQGGVALIDDVTAARDPRIQLVGYGPSASTIGANRAGRRAALAVRRQLAESVSAPRSEETSSSISARPGRSSGSTT